MTGQDLSVGHEMWWSERGSGQAAGSGMYLSMFGFRTRWCLYCGFL